MWIAGVWNPLSEFPDLLQVLQEKVRQNVIWGYENASPLAVHFRFTPQEESGAFGRRILLPPPLRGCPQGRPEEDPRTPSVGFASEDLCLISAPL